VRVRVCVRVRVWCVCIRACVRCVCVCVRVCVYVHIYVGHGLQRTSRRTSCHHGCVSGILVGVRGRGRKLVAIQTGARACQQRSLAAAQSAQPPKSECELAAQRLNAKIRSLPKFLAVALASRSTMTAAVCGSHRARAAPDGASDGDNDEAPARALIDTCGGDPGRQHGLHLLPRRPG